MTCEDVERDEVAEQYVLGRLEQDQQEAFEDHYFNCTQCLERLRVMEEMRAELARGTGGGRVRQWRHLSLRSAVRGLPDA